MAKGYLAADQLRFRHLALGMSHLLLKGLWRDNLRLHEDPGEAERQDARERPNKHAADRNVAGRSVAREAEQMATVMDKFVNIHTADQRRRTFFHPDKIDRENP